MFHNNLSAQILQALLGNGGLESQYDAYVDRSIRGCDTFDTFYTRILEADGYEAAEDALARWNREHRHSDLAASVELVAQGMFELARVDSEGVHVSVAEAKKEAAFPKCYSIFGPSQRIVAFIRAEGGCNCSSVAGHLKFAPEGHLGLRAVTLEVGPTREGDVMAQLGLVMSRRANSASVDDYTVATIDLCGSTNGHTYSPRIQPDAYLKCALGLIEPEQVTQTGESTGGYLDHAVGILDAANTLADYLPELGLYLASMAANYAH